MSSTGAWQECPDTVLQAAHTGTFFLHQDAHRRWGEVNHGMRECVHPGLRRLRQSLPCR